MNAVLRRIAALGAVTGAAVLAAAVPASAHVTVEPGSAEKGGYSTVALNVPNEQESADTVKVELYLPTDHPIASVATQPVPGWTVQVTRAKLKTPLKTDDGVVSEAVTKIVWTGGKIAPGQFQQFPLSLGPLPDDEDQLLLKTVQTYGNKDVVRWIEPQQKGQAEPENPAPALTLTSAPAADSGGTDATAAVAAPSTAAPAASAAGGGDTTARMLGVAGIVIGVLGLAFGLAARRRDHPTPSA
jgi:uncharacterized protein